MARPRNRTGNHPYLQLTYLDIQNFIAQLGPAVDEVLERVAWKVAAEAKASGAFKDSNKQTDVKRNLDYWPDERFPHKHLRPAIDVKKSKFPLGGWIVRANRPHGHLVEYGHYLVTPGGKTIGFVPPHAFLRPAKERVKAGLGRMEL